LATLCFFLGSCGESNIREVVTSETAGGRIVILSIDFQEGFVEDTAVILVNGEQVFRKEHISTNPLLGLADSFMIEVETGLVHIEIVVETDDITHSIPLEVSADAYIGISIVDGMIESIVSHQPFKYG
jgi:hypothetical protein